MNDEMETFRTKFSALSNKNKLSVFQLMQKLVKNDACQPAKSKTSANISLCQEKMEQRTK